MEGNTEKVRDGHTREERVRETERDTEYNVREKNQRREKEIEARASVVENATRNRSRQ